MRVKKYCSGTLLALFAVAVMAAGLVALTGAKPAKAADRRFEPAPNSPLSVGSAPTTVTNADFNGDGNVDLAAQNAGSNSISVLLGNGDGTFKAKQDFAVGSSPTSVSSADFNGDAKVDLAVANQGSSSVSVLLGNGDGTFQPKTDFATGSGPTSVTTGHFNADSLLDLATSNYNSSTVSVLLGQDLNGDGKGDGTFQPKKDSLIYIRTCNDFLCVDSTGGPNQVIAADFNGDTKADLATANMGICILICAPGGVSVLLGNGDGTFQNPALPKSGTPITSIDVSGSTDIVATEYEQHFVAVLLGNGNGTFSAGQRVQVGSNPSAVTSTDLDGDSVADIAVSNFTSDNVSVLRGISRGNFQAAQNFPAGDGPAFIIDAHFNDDGQVDFADLAVANQNSNNVSVLLNSPPDTTAPAPPVITSPANNTIDTDGSFTISGTAEANSTVELFKGTASLGTTTTNASGQWSKTPPSVGDGTHTYTAKAKDAAGNTSGSSSPLTVEVRIPPEVTNVSPANQAQSVALNASVEATFSEAMDEASVEELGTFTIKEQGSTTSVAATVSYNSSTRKATLDPSSNLASETTYTATILGGANGAKDLAGNALAQDHTWTFTTATAPPPPPAPPTVVSYTPTLTTGVPRGTEPTATFSTNMNEATLTPTTVKFQVYNRKKKKWISVAHTVGYDATKKEATVIPGSTLAASKKYRVTVTTSVRSSSGLALDQNANISGNQPKVWTFTTGTT